MKHTILFILILLLFSCCEKIMFEEDLQTDDPHKNFDYLWTECDEKYSFFDYKNIDWNTIKNKYRPMISKDMSDDSLFNVMAAMLNELKDDHANLFSNFNVSRYGNYRKGQDNFDWRIIVDHYLPEDYYVTGPFRHGYITDSIGYIRFSAFSGKVNTSNLNFVINKYKNTRGLIFDIRENGGGSISEVYSILSRFIDEKTLLYYSRIKTGPGHNEFSELEPISIQPSTEARYNKKVICLADRGAYSASSFMALGVRAISNITLIGDTTGGGLGVPNGGQLPNGWRYRFSITQTFDKEGKNYEAGVPPEAHALFNWNDLSTDEVLETAIDTIKQSN
ncbi:MAG: S41 family peptidase [Bacteroidales bacterium]|nr:S41 family peptidase [Bacteroidales bacterium]MCF8327396.1 S41 family peptidase [Bacteroidales bacterium]